MIASIAKILFLFALLFNANIPAQNKKLIENRNENGQLIEKYYIINDTLIDGEYLMWSEMGFKSVSGYYKKGVAEGKWIQYYKSGSKRIEGSFKNGKPDGIWITYLPNGAKISKTGVKEGFLHGEWAVLYLALTEDHIIFDCGDFFEGTGSREEWYLKNPINKKVSLLKAKGFFNNGLPSGTWTFYKSRLKETEVIFKRVKDEQNYTYGIDWEPNQIKYPNRINELNLKYFACERIPDFPSYIIKYFENGKMNYKAEFEDYTKIFEKKY